MQRMWQETCGGWGGGFASVRSVISLRRGLPRPLGDVHLGQPGMWGRRRWRDPSGCCGVGKAAASARPGAPRPGVQCHPPPLPEETSEQEFWMSVHLGFRDGEGRGPRKDSVSQRQLTGSSLSSPEMEVTAVPWVRRRFRSFPRLLCVGRWSPAPSRWKTCRRPDSRDSGLARTRGLGGCPQLKTRSYEDGRGTLVPGPVTSGENGEGGVGTGTLRRRWEKPRENKEIGVTVHKPRHDEDGRPHGTARREAAGRSWSPGRRGQPGPRGRGAAPSVPLGVCEWLRAAAPEPHTALNLHLSWKGAGSHTSPKRSDPRSHPVCFIGWCLVAVRPH